MSIRILRSWEGELKKLVRFALGCVAKVVHKYSLVERFSFMPLPLTIYVRDVAEEAFTNE